MDLNLQAEVRPKVEAPSFSSLKWQVHVCLKSAFMANI